LTHEYEGNEPAGLAETVQNERGLRPSAGATSLAGRIPLSSIEHSEAIVSVRGKERFAVMDIVQYHYLRECELEVALAEARADLAAGRFVQESPEEHVARVKSAA
jgi:hypothetical protein